MAELRKRKKATTTKARQAKAKSTPTPAKTKRPDGSISSGIYDAVEKLVAGGKMKRSEAFRQLSTQTGRKEGTISVNYYYAAKKRGAKLKRRGRPTLATGARNSAGASRIESVLKSLVELIRAQETELETLRRDGDRFAALRRLVGG